MKISELKKDDMVQEWFDLLNLKQNTKDAYLLSMQTFTEYVNKTPEELVKEAEADIKAGKLVRERSIKKHIVGFRKHLQESNYAPITVKNYLSGVKSFYRSFDIEIPTLPRFGSKARPLEKHNKIPDKEDLQEVLKVADPLEKAILLVGVSSGLSAIEVINLTVRKFKEGHDPETEITTLPLRREKVGYDFVTFLSPEASHAVWDYLSYRNRKPKRNFPRRRDQLHKQKVHNDDGYLFVARQIPDEYLTNPDEEMRKLSRAALMSIYRDMAEKAGKAAPIGTRNLIRSHNMRKYFNSALLNSGCDSFHVEYFMGHTLDDTRSAYFRASPDKLKEIYQKYVPFLTIQKELDISESAEYQQIKKENQILQAETARHIVERSELADVKAQLDAMKLRQNDINEILDKLKKYPDQLLDALDKDK